MIQYNGYYGCSWCLHPGIPVLHITKNVIKYPLLDNVPPLRTERDSLSHIRDREFGFLKSSSLLGLKSFNIIDGFFPDAMHCVDMGIVIKFATMWFVDRNKEYSIPTRIIRIINRQMASIKVPIKIVRLCRTINDLAHFNSREYQNWALFYSILMLQLVPNFKKYINHWKLFVEAYHILLQESIESSEIDRAKKLLKKFVGLTEKYYGADNMTYNMHQMLHISNSVRYWGPLWAHFGYPFESGNGRLIKSIKSPINRFL